MLHVGPGTSDVVNGNARDTPNGDDAASRCFKSDLELNLK